MYISIERHYISKLIENSTIISLSNVSHVIKILQIKAMKFKIYQYLSVEDENYMYFNIKIFVLCKNYYDTFVDIYYI